MVPFLGTLQHLAVPLPPRQPKWRRTVTKTGFHGADPATAPQVSPELTHRAPKNSRREPRSVERWCSPTPSSDRQGRWHLLLARPASLRRGTGSGPKTVSRYRVPGGAGREGKSASPAFVLDEDGCKPCDLRCRGLAAFRVLLRQRVRSTIGVSLSPPILSWRFAPPGQILTRPSGDGPKTTEPKCCRRRTPDNPLDISSWETPTKTSSCPVRLPSGHCDRAPRPFSSHRMVNPHGVLDLPQQHAFRRGCCRRGPTPTTTG